MSGRNVAIFRYSEGVNPLFKNLNLVMGMNPSLHIIYMYQSIRTYVDKMNLLVEHPYL